MKSWKTTAAGVGGLMAVIGSTLNQLLDGNPATNPDWNLALPIFFTSLIGIFARDNGVSSVDVGVDEGTKAIKKFAAGPPPVPMILLLATLSLGVGGCAWFQPGDIKPVAVAPGQDAALVNAERIHSTSLGVYRELITWELQHRAGLHAEVSRAVDKTRREFPKAWHEANIILKDYRANRGDSTSVNRISAALAAAQSSMLRLKVDASKSGELLSSLNSLSESIATLKKP